MGLGLTHGLLSSRLPPRDIWAVAARLAEP
jgi:hypothetical protein